VLDSHNERLLVEQPERGVDGKRIRELRQIVEQAGRRELTGYRRAVLTKIVLVVSIEQRHRQEHHAGAGSGGHPSELEHARHRRGANADEQMRTRWKSGRGALDRRPSIRDLEMWIFTGRAADADAVDACSAD